MCCNPPDARAGRCTAEVGRNRLALARGTDAFLAKIRWRCDFAKSSRPHPIPSSMASVTRRLLQQSRRCPSSIPSRSTPPYASQWQRPFSSTPNRSARTDRDDEPPRPAAKPAKPVTNTPEETIAQLRKFAEDFKQLDPEFLAEQTRKGKNGVALGGEFELETEEDFEMLEDDRRLVKEGFWAEGEPSMGADDDYYADDITSDAKGQLQVHRHLRNYARLIAWELPLLSGESPPCLSGWSQC